jgi:hypothetical protein
MFRKLIVVSAFSFVVASVACGDSNKSPASPSGVPNASTTTTDANADGSNLKVNGPEPVSPANNSTTADDFTATLRVNAAVPKYTSGVQFSYRFQLLNGSTVVREFTTAGLSWSLRELAVNTTYGWRCRAELDQNFGPWSATWTFRTPEQPEGYNRPGELYDPLYNGKTIGRVNNVYNFIPGKGIQLPTWLSYVEYRLPQTVRSGELSMIVSNVTEGTPGEKTKIMAMREGLSDITTNDRRMTVEKRGNSGVVAWRFITHFDQVDTIGPPPNGERKIVNFDDGFEYLWSANFRGNRFELSIFERRSNADAWRQVYRFGKNYEGALYDPSPHYAYAGGPAGRAGPQSGTVPGIIVRQVWLSNRPRPAFANK